MKNIEIYRTRKDELIEKTIELMPTALSGDIANRTFYFEINEKTGKLTVDYLYYLGQQSLDDECFFTIKDHETPDPEDFGYEGFEEMDFYACGFASQVDYAITEKIEYLEGYDDTL